MTLKERIDAKRPPKPEPDKRPEWLRRQKGKDLSGAQWTNPKG